MITIENIWQDIENRLKSFILSKIHDNAVADDILQEVFIKIHLKIDTLKDETKYQSWIYQITRNLIADYFRIQKKENDVSRNIPDTAEEVSSDEFLEEALQDMIEMMNELSVENCEALCMTELQGMSVKEYAQKAGISYTSAKSRVQRSRKMLKDMLMNCCHYEFDKYGTVLNISPNDCCCCNSENKK